MQISITKGFEFIKESSFLGSLIGALITGSTAIVVFLGDIIFRRSRESKRVKEQQIITLEKIKFVNNEVLELIKFFIDEFSVPYTEEKEFKLLAYITDLKDLNSAAKSVETELCEKELAVSILKYQRWLSHIYNEISSLPKLPLHQQAPNIVNLVQQVSKYKVEFDSFDSFTVQELERLNKY